jgi:hypothetical protein
MVGMRGLEPPRACAHYVLNVACIPISPHPRLCYFTVNHNTIPVISCYDVRYKSMSITEAVYV